MKTICKILVVLFAAFVVFAGVAFLIAPGNRGYELGGDRTPAIPAGIDHGEYDRLLKKYVDDRGLVDYAAWKANGDDLRALKSYLGQFAAAPGEKAEGAALTASLINGYNAFAMELILDHYPTDSIMALAHPFDGRRLDVGGEKVSLNDLEHGGLRPHYGYRAHAALVCVARSCPPLRNEAYRADVLEEQVTETFRSWLAREDLNRYDPEENRVEISMIFQWFAGDFENAGGTREVLARYGPEKYRDFLSGDDYEIVHLPYDWALNDRQPREFSRLRQGWARLLDYFR